MKSKREGRLARTRTGGAQRLPAAHRPQAVDTHPDGFVGLRQQLAQARDGRQRDLGGVVSSEQLARLAVDPQLAGAPYCAAPQLLSFDAVAATAQRSEIEDDAECRINTAHLVEA